MKIRTAFLCQQCGQSHPKWQGRCGGCGAWETLAEERLKPASEKFHRASPGGEKSAAVPIGELAAQSGTRLRTGASEIDTLLGGGIVPGSAILVGGEPGIGKSTLLLQLASRVAEQGLPVLYVSGEESASQLATRAERLGVTSPRLLVLAETSLQSILAEVRERQPQLLIIDSVQTMFSETLESQPGSVGQLRECAFAIIAEGKQRNMATFLVGHVTKDGAIAGPKVLEHMVDVVLQFENTASQGFRLLRGLKNRYGSTNELAVLEMRHDGIREVKNPSELFLSERPEKLPGSVVTSSLEGTRAFLVEVQALVSPTSMPMPRRTSLGLDNNRVALLVAILEKRGGYRLFDQDVYVNVAGGLRLSETATDLAVVAALLSSYVGKAYDPRAIFVGEVGLGGEVRSVPRMDDRLREAVRIGFHRAYIPAKAAAEIKKEGRVPAGQLEIIGVDHVQRLSDLA